MAKKIYKFIDLFCGIGGFRYCKGYKSIGA